MMKYFFWIAFAVFLAASIPHVAYFFASFEPSHGTEGLWWWIVSYAIAISIDITIYLLSWTAFQRYRRYHTPKAVWKHWLLIVMCTVFSWAVNWAYAKQFHSATMLNAAESAAPWLTSVFPFMASAFPLLGMVYTMMAETISETAAEEQQEQAQQMSTLRELAKQINLPLTTLRHTLTSGSRFSFLMPAAKQTTSKTMPTPGTTTEVEPNETRQPIIEPIVTTERDMVPPPSEQSSSPTSVTASNNGNSDKLQLAIEALRATPDMTDETLAIYLALKRPASAHFWRLKALEILNELGREARTNQSGHEVWVAPAEIVAKDAHRQQFP